MNYFTSKINTIRDQIVTMQPSATVSHQMVHYLITKHFTSTLRKQISTCTSHNHEVLSAWRNPEEQFHSFSTIGEEELYKLDKSSKPTTCMLDPIPSKLLKEVLPEVIDPLLAILIHHCH